MRDFLEARLGPYRRRGLLLDSNLLLLYVGGQTDRNLVASFKRTRSFADADFRLLVLLTTLFDSLVTTPHVLTEVNGLTNALAGSYRVDVRARLASDIAVLDERHTPAIGLASTTAFKGLGLTDAALAFLAQPPDGPLVLSTDGALIQFILNTGGAGDDFSTYQYAYAQR